MPFTADCIINLEELDAQHRYFIALVERIDTSTKISGTRERSRLVAEVVRYATFHFACEEALMDAYGYAGAEHRKEHEALLSRVRDMGQNPDLKMSALRLFLYRWLVDHIQLTDRDLADFVRSKRQEVFEDESPLSLGNSSRY
jgi:hemerythrin-like metal-binding protein